MIYSKAAMTITTCLLLGACAKSSDNNESVGSAPIQPSEVASTEITASGVSVSEFTTTSYLVTAGPQSVGELAVTNEEIYVAYPMLRERATFLSTITRAVETDAGTLDLYAGDVLMMTLVWNAETSLYTVRGPNTFVADSIVRRMSAVTATEVSFMDRLTFVISSCRTEVEQEEDVDQEQKQESKEEPKEVEYCSALAVKLGFDVIEQEQEQEQEEKEDKAVIEEKDEKQTQE